MSRSNELWQTHQNLVQACLQHPFVQGIASGTLSRAKFAYYVGQDAFFLEAFARAYSIAAAKAPDWEGFTTFHQLAAGVLTELELHQHYAASWGVDLRTGEPGVATRRYTDFLQATAWSSDSGTTAIAMLPCMRLYSFLGQQLAQPSIPQHQYSDWIKTYSSPEFDQLASQLETLANRYLPLNANSEAIYRYALQCERDFFEMAWNSSYTEN